jgi:hypothetical protein
MLRDTLMECGLETGRCGAVEKPHIWGLFTGSAFPQGGAIINSHLPCRKKPEALQNAHLLCCAANRTA